MRNINEGASTNLNTFKLQKVDSKIVTIEYRKKPLTIETAGSNGSLNTMETKSTLFYAESELKQTSPITSTLGNPDSMKYIDFPFNFVKESSVSKLVSPSRVQSKSVLKTQKLNLFENSFSKRMILQ